MVISWKGGDFNMDDNEDTYGQLVRISHRDLSEKLIRERLIIPAAQGLLLLAVHTGAPL